MKKEKLFFATLTILYTLLSLSFLYAECNTRVYVYDSQAELTASQVYGYCEKLGLNATSKTSDFYTYILFGGLNDDCESLCGNIWIYAMNEETGLGGYSLYFPMNISNDQNWSKKYELHISKIMMDTKKEEIILPWLQPIQPQINNSAVIINNESLISNSSIDILPESTIENKSDEVLDSPPEITQVQENITENSAQSQITGDVINQESEGKPLLVIRWIYVIIFFIVIFVITFLIFFLKGKSSEPTFNYDQFKV